MLAIVTDREVLGIGFQRMNPRNCPVLLRDGEGKPAGACWHYLEDHVCPVHGRIYGEDSQKDKSPPLDCGGLSP